MAEAAPWEIAIRVETAHALSRKGCPRGWALTEHRGFARLNITAKAGGGKRRQIQLPIPWHFDHAKKIGEVVCKIYDDFSSGIEPELAAKKIAFTSAEESNDGSATVQRLNPEQQTHCNALIERYREYKIRSCEIKDSTWTMVHRHHMRHLLDQLTLHWADPADSWVLEACPVLPHRHAEPFGIQVQLIQQKWVGMAGAKAHQPAHHARGHS